MLEVAINSFSYSSTEVLNNVSFTLKKGEHLAVLGESGCGKTTLLKLIYGLLPLKHGAIHWDNTALLGPAYNIVPGESFIKFVPQEFDLMPFTSVAENISEHLGRTEIEKDAARVEELLAVVGLSEFANTKVKSLSGGQKQRVALAKALAKKPLLLLLDEPFSHIDTFRKNKLRRSIYSYLKANNISCITATHDASEALGYADKLCILKQGKVEAFGSPEAIYHNLENEYQAGFFDEVNVLPGELFSGTAGPEKLILFPYELIVSAEPTSMQVKTIDSYFQGSHYLIRALWKNKEVFFTHKTAISNGKTVFLTKNGAISPRK